MSVLGREHLTSKEILRLLSWEGQVQDLVDALFHLTICEACREQAHVLEPEKTRSLMLRVFGREDPPPIPPDAIEKSEVQGLISDFQQRFSVALDELRRVDGDLVEFLSHPSPRRRLLVENTHRYCRESLAWLLLEEVKAICIQEPEEAEELADLTLAILRRLPNSGSKPRRLNDLKALTLTYRANCRRIRCRLRASSRDFDRARVCLAQGEGKPLDAAQVDEYQASLYRDQRQFEHAGFLVRRASRTYRAFGDARSEARLMIVEGTILRAAGRQEEACELLEELLAMFAPEEIGKKMVYFIHHNLTTYLTELGEVEKALDRLPQVRLLADSFADRYGLVRLDWLEAMILERVGQTTTAIELYSKVLDSFTERRFGYDAALVALDLAALYLDTGRTTAAKELTADLVPLFEAHEIHREAAAALALFFRAVEQERATVALARDVARYLKTTKDRAGLRYEPAPDLFRS